MEWPMVFKGTPYAFAASAQEWSHTPLGNFDFRIALAPPEPGDEGDEVSGGSFALPDDQRTIVYFTVYENIGGMGSYLHIGHMHITAIHMADGTSSLYPTNRDVYQSGYEGFLLELSEKMERQHVLVSSRSAYSDETTAVKRGMLEAELLTSTGTENSKAPSMLQHEVRQLLDKFKSTEDYKTLVADVELVRNSLPRRLQDKLPRQPKTIAKHLAIAVKFRSSGLTQEEFEGDALDRVHEHVPVSTLQHMLETLKVFEGILMGN